jgi:hypothetical protein
LAEVNPHFYLFERVPNLIIPEAKGISGTDVRLVANENNAIHAQCCC